METDKKKTGCLCRLLRWFFGIAAVILVLIAVALLVLFHSALYNRFYAFPRQAAAWEDFKKHRVPVALETDWKEFRGVCHSHSELSHDSKVPFPEILEALRAADVNFICMTDHLDENKADYSRGWKGLHDGILFIRGYEMNYGFMPWGLPDNMVLDAKEPADALAKRIAAEHGVIFFAHCEETRPWDLPEVSGMEIVNLHVDFMRGLKYNKIGLFTNILLNIRAYPDQSLRVVAERPSQFVKKWDEMNRTRPFTGIGANDCHQNVGFRGFYTVKDTFLIRDTGHIDERVAEFKLNFLTRGLLRLVFGKLEPDKLLFRFDLDPYQRSARYVNTHILAKDLSEEQVIDALRQGRVFVGFDMVADARGFRFMAESGGAKAVMGETMPFAPGLKLRMASPLECRFTLLKDGEKVGEQFGTAWDYTVPGPGKYRVEADLQVAGEWTPWVYANPIQIKG